MPTHFSETVPGGTVSGTRAVERQGEGLVVEYALKSTGDESVTVRLVDGLPTADLAEYGFHEEYEPADWRVADGELDAEVALDPGVEQTYVLGMIASEGGELAFDSAEPELQIVTAGQTDQSESGDDEAAPNQRINPDGSADLQRVDADGGVVSPEADRGSVASALIAELESGAVPESQRAKLKEHLAVEGSESEAVRLEYVQKRLADFDAYVDALEDLLSVHGEGDDAIAEIDDRLDRLEGFVDDVEAIRQRQDELAERLDDLSAGLDAQAETIESLQVAHQEDVDDVRTEIRRRAEVMCEEFNDLEQSITDDVATLEAEIEAFESIRRTLVDGLQRPDDTPPDTTVEEADLGAVDDTEAITVVDSSDGDDSSDGEETPNAGEVSDDDTEDADDTGDGDDETSESDDGSSEEPPTADLDLQESLETAEATHFSVSSGPEQSDSNGSDADGETELEHVDDAFVSPDSVSAADEADEEPDPEDGSDSVSLAFESSSTDRDGGSGRDDGSEPNDESAGGTAVDGADGPVGGSDHDPEEASDEVDDGADREAEKDEAEEGDGEDHDEEADESPKRASSIFEIGDVDTKQSGDDEMPTIDFEDS